ncbi:potassium transporter Trk, partial [Bifidobacterium longum]
IQMTAVSVTTACFALVMVGAMMLMFTTGCAFVDAVFEACSAFSLGGYSVGVASAGNPASLFILSAEMIVGRLGPLTIAYSISRPMAPEPIRYPQENIIVG